MWFFGKQLSELALAATKVRKRLILAIDLDVGHFSLACDCDCAVKMKLSYWCLRIVRSKIPIAYCVTRESR